MISCTLNNQKYTIDFVSGRALREMEPAAKMYGRIVALRRPRKTPRMRCRRPIPISI